MQKLALAQEKDLPALGKVLRRSQMDIEEAVVDEQTLLSFMKQERVYFLKDGVRVLSFALISPFPMDELFPDSLKQQEEFLYDLGYFGEPLVLLKGIFTDPMYQKKGYGSLLFSSLASAKKQATFFLSLPQKQKQTLHFFEKFGFVAKGLTPTGSLILVRKKKKEGLCSDPSF